MTEYRIAFNAETKVATILQPDSKMPDGSSDVGMFHASAVAPNPTDASIQHITTMLQRNGFTDAQVSGLTINHEPVTEVVERRDDPKIEDNMSEIADAFPVTTLDLGVGEDAELFPNGKVEGTTFTSSDEDILKVDDSGKATGVASGQAYVDVTDAAGNTNQIVITVRQATDGGEYAGQSDAEEADAKPAGEADPVIKPAASKKAASGK